MRKEFIDKKGRKVNKCGARHVKDEEKDFIVEPVTDKGKKAVKKRRPYKKKPVIVESKKDDSLSSNILNIRGDEDEQQKD